MTSKDVISVEYARMLKMAGLPQATTAYWYGTIASLDTIQGEAPIATEKIGKVKWRLVLAQPPDPSASAYTLKELKDWIEIFKEANPTDKPLPEVRQVNKTYIASVGDKDLFTGKSEPNVFAQAVLYFIKIP